MMHPRRTLVSALVLAAALPYGHASMFDGMDSQFPSFDDMIDLEFPAEPEKSPHLLAEENVRAFLRTLLETGNLPFASGRELPKLTKTALREDVTNLFLRSTLVWTSGQLGREQDGDVVGWFSPEGKLGLQLRGDFNANRNANKLELFFHDTGRGASSSGRGAGVAASPSRSRASWLESLLPGARSLNLAPEDAEESGSGGAMASPLRKRPRTAVVEEASAPVEDLFSSSSMFLDTFMGVSAVSISRVQINGREIVSDEQRTALLESLTTSGGAPAALVSELPLQFRSVLWKRGILGGKGPTQYVCSYCDQNVSR